MDSWQSLTGRFCQEEITSLQVLPIEDLAAAILSETRDRAKLMLDELQLHQDPRLATVLSNPDINQIK